MECTVTWTGATGTRSGMGFLAETGSGHTLVMDGAPDAAKPENGGLNLAPRPMETLLAGAGGCTAYDVVLILKRGRHDVRGCQLKLTAERDIVLQCGQASITLRRDGKIEVKGTNVLSASRGPNRIKGASIALN